jgi:hypothetical protein
MTISTIPVQNAEMAEKIGKEIRRRLGRSSLVTSLRPKQITNVDELKTILVHFQILETMSPTNLKILSSLLMPQSLI